MTDFKIGDEVRVAMPRGVSKRGIPGISVLYTTWPEARFDGASGRIIGVDPRSRYGIPLYLVDFSKHKNRVAIPWQRQWFRGEWIVPIEDNVERPVATEGALVAATGAGETTLKGST
jgi:ribosomal protein L21E